MSNVKYVYKPRINGNNVVYRNSNGENIKCTFYKNTQCLPNALNSCVSGKSPNVTKEQLLENVYKQVGLFYKTDAGSYSAVVLKRLESLIKLYSEKSSEGEENGVITQNEQFKMMEIWHRWFGFDKEYQSSPEDSITKTLDSFMSNNKQSVYEKGQLLENIYLQTGHIYTNHSGYEDAIVLERLESLIELYSGKYSEGEEGMITKSELQKIKELFKQWFCFSDK